MWRLRTYLEKYNLPSIIHLIEVWQNVENSREHAGKRVCLCDICEVFVNRTCLKWFCLTLEILQKMYYWVTLNTDLNLLLFCLLPKKRWKWECFHSEILKNYRDVPGRELQTDWKLPRLLGATAPTSTQHSASSRILAQAIKTSPQRIGRAASTNRAGPLCYTITRRPPWTVYF